MPLHFEKWLGTGGGGTGAIVFLTCCVNAHGEQFEHFFLKLSSFISVSDIFYLTVLYQLYYHLEGE